MRYGFGMSGGAGATRDAWRCQLIEFCVRRSDSPYVDRVWRARSRHGGEFTSIAAPNNEIVIERREGRTILTLRGPESAASAASCPPDTEWLGIRLRIGTYFHAAPSGRIRDGRDVTFELMEDGFVVAAGTVLPLPCFGDVETFVHRLAAAGYVRYDAVVEAVAGGGRR
jgi:hypothetical protein